MIISRCVAKIQSYISQWSLSRLRGRIESNIDRWHLFGWRLYPKEFFPCSKIPPLSMTGPRLVMGGFGKNSHRTIIIFRKDGAIRIGESDFAYTIDDLKIRYRGRNSISYPSIYELLEDYCDVGSDSRLSLEEEFFRRNQA